MNKKIVKLSVIRSDESQSCPFGLAPINYVCQIVGDIIYNMAPIDIMGENSSLEEKKEIAEANNYLLRWRASGNRCPFASKLFPENQEVVHCSWDENITGVEGKGVLRGSPFFYRHFSGNTLDGLYTYPLGYYSDNSIDIGQYYGPFSLESIAEEEDE